VDVDQRVAIGVGDVDRIGRVGERDAAHQIGVVEQRHEGVDRGAAAGADRAGPVVALGQRAAVVDGRRGPAVGHDRGRVQVRALAVVEDRERAVEAIAGEALLEPERAVVAAELEVVLGRDLAGDDAIEHQAVPPVRLGRCSRSMLSNSARKLPAPKPRSPLRWMIS
jgi:hypothetical protein